MTFYEYIKRFVDPKAEEPISLLANIINQDQSFPKHSSKFDEISDYIEHSVAYTNLVKYFDEAWTQYQFERGI